MKKPQLENIHADVLHSFRVKHSVLAHLDSPWHHHEAVELFYIHRGAGTRFVGDHIGPFGAGDLVLTGPHLPHVWKDEATLSENNVTPLVEAICVQFELSALGNGFFDLPEMNEVQSLLQAARRGLLVEGRARMTVVEHLWELVGAQGVRRIILLVKILNVLATARVCQPLSSEGFLALFDHEDSGRMNQVFHYLTEHFTRPLTLDEVAAVAHMSKTAFCRYFKTRTRKTFLEYLNEMRIGYACKLLVERDHSISEVAPTCGFHSVPYFSRQFKRVTGFAPGEYRAKFDAFHS